MKLEKIKTHPQFDDFADNWYQRTHMLRRVWQDCEQTEEKRRKARRLWCVMYRRIMKLVQIKIYNSQRKYKSCNK